MLFAAWDLWRLRQQRFEAEMLMLCCSIAVCARGLAF